MSKRSARRDFAIIFVIFLLQWIVLFSQVTPTWDGAFYYSYARSIILDHDLMLNNDLVLAYPTGGEQFATKGLDQQITSTGYVDNTFAPATAFQWMPWLFIWQWSEINAYEPLVLRTSAAIGTIAGLITFAIVYWVTNWIFNRRIALLLTITAMFATPLVHYQFRDPFYSHVASAFATTLCVACWLRFDKIDQRWQNNVGIGMIYGLAILVRWQHAIYLILPAVTVFNWWWQDKRLRSPFTYLFTIGIGVSAVVSIQLTMWYLFYGKWLTIPQGESYFTFWPHWVWPTLFSPFRGLLAWMPFFVLAGIGLLFLSKNRPKLGLPLLSILLLSLFVNASTPDWFGGGGFGPRRFTSELIIVAIGYGALINQIKPRWRTPSAILLLLLLGWQQLALLRYGVLGEVGGRVVQMAPTFEWYQESWGVFLKQLGQTMWQAIAQPSEFWLFHATPLQGDGLSIQLSALLIASVIWCIYLGVGWFIGRNWQRSPLLLILTLVAIAAFDLWILFAA